MDFVFRLPGIGPLHLSANSCPIWENLGFQSSDQAEAGIILSRALASVCAAARRLTAPRDPLQQEKKETLPIYSVYTRSPTFVIESTADGRPFFSPRSHAIPWQRHSYGNQRCGLRLSTTQDPAQKLHGAEAFRAIVISPVLFFSLPFYRHFMLDVFDGNTSKYSVSNIL